MAESTPPSIAEHSYRVMEPLDGREMILPLRSLVRAQALTKLCESTPCLAESEADITITLRRERGPFGEHLVATAAAVCSDPRCLAAYGSAK